MKKLSILLGLILFILFANSGCSSSSEPGVDSAGIWHIFYFSDKFGDTTDEAYMISDNIEGTYEKYSSSPALLNIMVYKDEDAKPAVGMKVRVPFYGQFQPLQGFLETYSFKVSGSDFDTFTFSAELDNEIKRFEVRDEIAAKLIKAFSTAESMDIKAVSNGLIESNFKFAVDSITGFRPVYKRYDKLYKTWAKGRK